MGDRTELTKRCGNGCGASQGVSKFQVIAGLNECWTDEEIADKTGQTCLTPLMDEEGKNTSKYDDGEEKAMWNLIRNGLITCKGAQERVVREFQQNKRNQGSQNNPY